MRAISPVLVSAGECVLGIKSNKTQLKRGRDRSILAITEGATRVELVSLGS